MDLQHHHFCTGVSAPDRLDDVYNHIEREFSARRCPPLSNVQLLLTGSSSAMASGNMARRSDLIAFPDASEVERTTQAMALYLARLIAPDDVADVRRIVDRYLHLEELPTISDLLADLNERAPEIVTALLELRIGRAHRLVQDLLQCLSRSEREDSPDYRVLVSDMGRVRVAYLLRTIAQDCGRQIHAPYGLDALDCADEASDHGTPRTGPVVERVRSESKLTQRVLQLCIDGSPSYTDRTPCAARPKIGRGGTHQDNALSVTDEAFVRSLGFEERARVQLALWQAQHGDDFEPLLMRTVKRMRCDLEQLGEDLKARLDAAKWNSVAGNFDRTPAGVRLYFAVERAIAWTWDAGVYDEDSNKRGDDWEYLLTRCDGPPESPMSEMEAWLTRFPCSEGDAPKPRSRREHADAISRVFMALRFAFLRDAEMLPVALRVVLDQKTGQEVLVKTAEKAARVRGRPYSFAELGRAFEEDLRRRERKLPADATPSRRSKVNQIDYDMKRSARQLRKMLTNQRPPDMEEAEAMFDALVMQGYLAD